VAPLQARAPEIAQLVALLPRGGWGADELIALATWLTSHGYDVGGLSDIFNEEFKDDEEPSLRGFRPPRGRLGDLGAVRRGPCRQCPDDTGAAEGRPGWPAGGQLLRARLRLCGTGRA